MRLVLLLCFLSMAFSCGVKKSSTYKMGKTTRAEVIAEKGQFLSEVINPIPNSTTLKFKNDESFQLKGDIVVNWFSNPEDGQSSILWWRHRFKECRTRTTELKRDSNSHIPSEVELACPEEGISVIYTQGSDVVSRVVHFEK